MNPLMKVYCRAYQLVFRAAMPILPYREPERFGSVEELKEALHRLKPKGVLLVTDAQLRAQGTTRSFEELLEKMKIPCIVYDRTRPNPTVENVEEALRLYKANRCDCLAAIGGGSAMDCAKGVGARAVNPKRSIMKMKGILKVFRRIPPLIAIPTTAGTGSEATVTSVITDEATKHKCTMSDFVLIPSHTVHAPELTRSLPPSLTATTGMDALTHAVEAYIGRSTTKETRRYALEATRLVFENVEKAYRDGNDLRARRSMLEASYLAGQAFSKSYVGYLHAVAHSLGGQYNIPHGLANAVLLPVGLEIYGKSIHKKLHELAMAAGMAGTKDSDETAAKIFIEAIRGLNARMNIPARLSGIRQEDIPVMAAHAHKEANPLYPVPVLMDAKELAVFYEAVADWSEEK